MPEASEKEEGALISSTALLPSIRQMILFSDAFFDGKNV